MKKYLYLILFFSILLINKNVYAKKYDVKLKTCIDGDTAILIQNNENIKVRFLAIDTPETKYSEKGEQPYGDEASKFTCNKLKNANSIEVEYDSKSNKTDKYDRHLVWVWIDNKLLQKEIIKNGLGKVTYLYDNYKYTKELKQEETIAKKNKIGIWSTYNNNSNINNQKKEKIFNKNITIYELLAFGIIVLIIAIIKIKKH